MLVAGLPNVPKDEAGQSGEDKTDHSEMVLTYESSLNLNGNKWNFISFS